VTARQEITIGEFVSLGEAEIKTGPFGTQLKAAEYVDVGTPVTLHVIARMRRFGRVTAA
jgi:hypothetical protein